MHPNDYSDDEWLSALDKCPCPRCTRTRMLISAINDSIEDQIEEGTKEGIERENELTAQIEALEEKLSKQEEMIRKLRDEKEAMRQEVLRQQVCELP